MSLFHFLRPNWLYALVPLAFIVWCIYRQQRQHSQWYQICDSHLISHLLINPTARKRLWPLLLMAWVWGITVLALAGPTWSKLPQILYRHNNAVMLVLDLSRSMLARDIKPDRLMRAKYKVLDLLNHMHEGQVGMVVFTQEAYIVSPLTQDSHTIAAMVPALTPLIMPVQGSNIAAGLHKAAQLLQQGQTHSGTIILITDSAVTKSDVTMAKKIQYQGYKISILGIGTQQGAPIPLNGGGFLKNANRQTVIAKLPNAQLKALATAGGGQYVAFTATNRDVNTLLKPLQQHILQHATKTKAKTTIWRDEGRLLLFLILPLVLLAFRRGWLEELIQ